MIDNSSAFRMDDEVPLVVPEVNPEAIKNRPKGIIANPNCTTIITLMALYPLHKLYGLKSIIASSYQAVSGSGAQGIIELDEQIKVLGAGGEILPFASAPAGDADAGRFEPSVVRRPQPRHLIDQEELIPGCGSSPSDFDAVGFRIGSQVDRQAPVVSGDE